MKKIYLPGLRGNIGDWEFYSSVMRVKDCVDSNRVITVPESKELYTENINQILQREIDASRIKKIKDYLLQNKERFFNSLILAIHKGNPQWADIDFERHYKIDNKIIKDDEISFIENKVGILTLSGNEEIFVLDGQHRLLGLRKAYSENPEIGQDEVSVIFIVHRDNKKEKTRRLFTVLNRYSVAIKPAEKVILEEDDAAAILTRRLVEKHPIFKLDNAVSDSKQLALSSNDKKNFTTLVCLYEINKILIDYKRLYSKKVIIRPSGEELDKMYNTDVVNYWDNFFKTFPDVVKFIKGQKVSNDFIRNNENGGSLLLRPEGQILIATVYIDYKQKGQESKFKRNITHVDFNLSSQNWMYVFWKGNKMEGKYKRLKKSILQFLLGNTVVENYVHDELKKIYATYNAKYVAIKPV